MSNSKLLKVMDYLINEQEDKARDLLHQIFIEKARAIHEELMGEDDEEVLGGDEGLGLGHEIEQHKDEIESEEHYGDGTMEDVSLDDAVEDLGDEMEDAGDAEMDDDADEDMEDEIEVDVDDEDHMDHEEASEEERFHDLEQAIEELKAEFEALKGEEAGEAEDEGEADEAGEEEEVDEDWMDDTDDLDEDFDDLEEGIELDTVSIDAKKVGEVGSGKYARPGADKSAVPPSQKELMGAKPVVTKSKGHTGYDLQSAPSSEEIKGTANRRRKATDGMSGVSKEGSTKALLNKDRSEGFGASNVRSPLGSGTTPKK